MAPPSSAATTSVQVALRIRPATAHDATTIPARFQRTIIHAASSNAVAVDPIPSGGASGSTQAAPNATAAPAKKQTFVFDQVLGPATTQYELFMSTAEPIIARFLEGFNCTILAYGQTSSGKTYSMTGVDLDADPSNSNNGMGIIPRSISTIFSRARAMKEERNGAWNFSIKGSFVELYNEDLIDLLAIDESGGRREVQIREDKDGHIIWGGLREVNVRSANEVMSLIRQGTAIRRTNETDMNAQSSRSHAIFSLTMTQKKFTGSGPPPRSPSPLPPGGRSPSRLARPTSTYSGAGGSVSGRVSSPTFGRPQTPSFAVAMGRGGSSLRPSSAMGSHNADGRARSADDDPGEWVTIVSKFHFVDLAGSERLKRTAAAGDRIKEGISINSGLLALGNVISALGDPSRAKSHTASHVPYRDSKLTRLLQDSLGGNAHTLMIACVSPAEWNAGETVNTLKYANRARNIKNRAVVTEKEEGWDDVEWLQNMVTRLRKDLKTIREGGVLPTARDQPVELEGASKRVLEQMVDLQSNYESLRAKFVERTEELTRLRRELGERQRSSTAGAIGGTSKYEEIVGPVIEEYEKTISAMEAELSLNRAALRHTNDLVEEKEEELSVLTERHSATEMYVEELKSRVMKLSEREATTEAYIRDLEEKVKHHEDTSMTSNESVSEFKREIAKHKEEEVRNSQYIADLEARLTRSDESVLTLRETVEKLENDVETRRQEVGDLKSRLNSLLHDGDSWRSDLEERERNLKELEAKMEDWESRRMQAGEDRVRLGDFVNGVQRARRSLEVDLQSANKVNGEGMSTASNSSLHGEADSLEAQLASLQETHAATLADLSSVTSKYRDALREISDLAAQIQEAKLSPSIADPADFPEPPPPKRRLTTGRSREFTGDAQPASPGRRPFFRQAASSESLHTRSLSQSQLLSQELSSARSRKKSYPDINGFGSLSIPRSRSSSSTSQPNSQPSMSPSLLSPPGGERSVASLEKEIMRLQEVLKEREGEITSLEKALKEREEVASSSAMSDRGDPIDVNGRHTPDLSPQIMNQFEAIRRSVELRHPPTVEGESVSSEADDSLVRLNELMLSMAQKESRHREVVEDLNEKLEYVRRQHDDLSKLSRDQAHNMSTELEALRGKHGESLGRLEELERREAELLEERQALEDEHADVVQTLRAEHEQAMRDKEIEVQTLLTNLKEEHDLTSKDLHNQLADASASLAKSHQEHEEAFGKLKEEHEEALRGLKEEVDATLATTKTEHEAALAKVRADHGELTKSKDEEHSTILQHTEEEYYTALDKLRTDHAEFISRKDAEHSSALERLKEEHASQLKMAEIAREGTLTESQSEQAAVLRRLQDEHAADTERREAAFVEDLNRIQDDHSRAMGKKEEEHAATLQKLKSKHSTKVAELTAEKELEIGAISDALVKIQKDHEASSSKLQEEHQASTSKLRQEHESVISQLRQKHEVASSKLREELESSLTQLVTEHGQFKVNMEKEWTEEIAKLKAEHQHLVTELQSAVVAAQEQHRGDLENARIERDKVALLAKQNLAKSLADLQDMHAKELDTMRKDHDLLVEELASHKAASDEFAMAREEDRSSHESALQERDKVIDELEHHVGGIEKERDDFKSEVATLRAELERTRNEQARLVQEASRRDSIIEELERHRSLLGEVQTDLQRTKDHRDTLLNEKSKQDSVLRELQAQLQRNASPPPSEARPATDRNTSYTRVNGVTKLPPLTPPPSVPPPPAPKGVPPVPTEVSHSTSSHTSTMRSSSSSRDSNPDSPLTSVGPSSANGHGLPDPKIVAQLDEQARQIEEQEVMIKTLNKQLTHCESDLQVHMDLVATLETSLGDSEKNLRKARMQATELARERDTLNGQIDRLRNELEDAKREVVSVRRSIVEEKETLQNRLDEERRAKERARAQLDSRVEELQKRKSKFVCL
ncbi:kinesin [Rickenella mellea]|uniref:Kinesin n=1 Tax=Rickenella mellea TaxID=50990 RepID=A0A4Y7QB90_9AGAM|nr:kinesin [Rickenella mellea]